MEQCTYCEKFVKIDLFPIKIFGKKDQQYCSYSCLCKSKSIHCQVCGKYIDFSTTNERIIIKHNSMKSYYCSFPCIKGHGYLYESKENRWG